MALKEKKEMRHKFSELEMKADGAYPRFRDVIVGDNFPMSVGDVLVIRNANGTVDRVKITGILGRGHYSASTRRSHERANRPQGEKES